MKDSSTKRVPPTLTSALLGAVLIFLTTAPVTFAGENALLHGKTIGEWSAGWWQWQGETYPGFSFGEGEVDCSLGQSGPVWYLGGTGGGEAERECDAAIKGHKHLMFPLVNYIFWNPDEDGLCKTTTCTVDEKRGILDGLLSEDPPGIGNSEGCLLQAYLDEIPVVYSTAIVRTQSPPFQYTDAVLEADDPEAISDGFWVVLNPLPRGEHTIRFTGGVCDLDTGGSFFDVDVTYDLTVGK